jgi:transposase-like protein
MPKVNGNNQNHHNASRRCKYCGSNQIVKYGSYHSIQRLFCKQCQRKFADNDSPPNMRTASVEIASALGMFYEGMSLNAIRRNLFQTFNNTSSNSTIYKWILKYSKMAVSANRVYSTRQSQKSSQILGHGPFWVTNETAIQIEGQTAWICDVMDSWSRFLIVSRLAFTRTSGDLKAILETASERTGEVPGLIITGKMRAYPEAIDMAFGSDTMHVQATGSTVHPQANYIDRFYTPLRVRGKTLRGIKKLESANLIIHSWLVYYNFFRPNIGLGNAIPSHKAEIEFPYRTWLDIVEEEHI